MLHFNQNFPHHIFLHRIVQYIIVGLERLLISDIFQDHRLTVFRTYRIEIQVGNGRHLLINLCQ